jgi:uncharacterized protein
MKNLGYVITGLLLISIACRETAGERESNPNYLNNRPPLRPNPYIELPLGAIKPEGWLKDQLETMADGMTGHLDELYPSVLGKRNGWLGGDGDGWERGPYWIDGLLPLAWQLEDEVLQEKVKHWVEWSLANQRDDGYFGPVPFETPPETEEGIQKSPRRDWWPKMVMLKVLKQYYTATGDERVIDLMTAYFRFQLRELPETPLDHWSFWANRRGADNLMSVYWLYNITGDSFLLELADLIHEQTFPYTKVFLNDSCGHYNTLDHLYHYNTGNRYPFDEALIDRLCIRQLQSFHCVNLAQGIKAPLIYYQQHPDVKYLAAVKKAFQDIRKYHGQPQGMYGADEPMHGNDPTRGVEFCSVVEMMFSLENMAQITGDMDFLDHLEKITFNALPAQAMDDYSGRQYFQAANQVMLTRTRHNFYEDDSHDGTDLCYGLLTGYPCCTCNMHQGWPKFTQNTWYATADAGLAALQYAPGTVRAMVADGKEITIREETDFPFGEKIRFTLVLNEEITFPLHFRLPGWCREPQVFFNGQRAGSWTGGQIVVLKRAWKNGDVIELNLPMHIEISRWAENSAVVERGPLVYSLNIDEEWNFIKNEDKFGDYWEVLPASPWNYGLLQSAIDDPYAGFTFEAGQPGKNPWKQQEPPSKIRTQGKRIPEWTLYYGNAGPLPHSRPQLYLRDKTPEEIFLVPYGWNALRITEFPVVE